MIAISEYYRDARPDIQRLLDVRDKCVLDVGCAAGELGRALKQAGAQRVIGIERVPEAAELARRELDVVYAGDLEDFDPPLADASVDYIIFGDVLEHTSDPWALLARYRRYLRPGGRVIASIPNIRFYAIIARLMFNRWGYRESGILDRTHLRFFTLPTIREMFQLAGYRIERIERKHRLFEDQSDMGRLGALSSRIFARAIAPFIGRELFTFQYLIVAAAQ